uniref:Uncharacterized protein n=1 Tax=Schistocephalus solidus TaxID=70667 RepID=A0A0X3PP81_SCHSO
MPTKTHGAIRLLFWVQILSAGELPTKMRFISVTNEVLQSKVVLQSLVFWNSKGILLTNMSECLSESDQNLLKKTVQTKGFYFDQLKSAAVRPQENGVWQTVNLECHFLPKKKNEALETLSSHANCFRNFYAISTSILIFGLFLTSLSLLILILSCLKWRKALRYSLDTSTNYIPQPLQECIHTAENEPQSKHMRTPKNSEIVCVNVNYGKLEFQAILPDEPCQSISSQPEVVKNEVKIEKLNEVRPRDHENSDFHTTFGNSQAKQKPKIIIENQLNNDVLLQITPFA